MNQRSDHSKDERLNADPQDPRLSVHGLSEFVFCSRAGLCLHEQEHDLDESEGDADLSYLPIHEPERLRLVLQTLTRQFLWILGGGLTVFFLLAFAAWFSGRLELWIAAGCALLLTVWGLYDRGYWVYRAQRQLELWQDAVPVLPNADSPKIQDIDWRSLLASEMTVFRPPSAYYDPSWKLGGRPWRVLEYGDLRIPVFKHRAPWKDLFPQHFVRMAAYCHLLEVCEGARSPYGVILKGQTYSAVTVPNTQRTRAMFHQALLAAREVVRESEEVNRSPLPPEPSLCHDCPCGWPVRLRSDERYLRHGGPLQQKVARDHQRRKYHSHCGDRFQWIPPHRQAIELGLSDG